jgi:hypothetical protein
MNSHGAHFRRSQRTWRMWERRRIVSMRRVVPLGLSSGGPPGVFGAPKDRSASPPGFIAPLATSGMRQLLPFLSGTYDAGLLMIGLQLQRKIRSPRAT